MKKSLVKIPKINMKESIKKSLVFESRRVWEYIFFDLRSTLDEEGIGEIDTDTAVDALLSHLPHTCPDLMRQASAHLSTEEIIQIVKRAIV